MEATDNLNQLLMRFQVIVAGLAAAGVTAEITHEYGWDIALPWTVGIGILATALCWLWLRYGLRRLRGQRHKIP